MDTPIFKWTPPISMGTPGYGGYGYVEGGGVQRGVTNVSVYRINKQFHK